MIPPPVAVTVIVVVPGLALDAAVSFNVLAWVPAPARAAGENVAVTPAGRLLADRLTAELNDPTLAIVTLSEVLDFLATPAEAVLWYSVKSGGGETVNISETLLVTPPPMAVIVMGYLPATVLGSALNVSALAPAPGAVTVPGEKLAVIPVGAPLALNATSELNPFATLRLTLTAAVAPNSTVDVVTPDFSVNVGGSVTVSANGTDLVTLPPTALMVMARVPVAAVGDALNVSTVDPEPGAPRLGEEKLAVTPAAMPVALNVTAELKAASPAIVRVTAAVAPCVVVADGALAVSVKPGGGVTVIASAAV